MILVKGIMAAGPAVSWTLIFLVLVIYFFSVTFRILCKENALGQPYVEDGSGGYFSSIPHSMSSLLLPGLLPDAQDHVRAMAKESLVFAVIFMIFFVIAGITIMNMLVGVLVDVISVVALAEKEQLSANYVKAELKLLMETELDTDANGTLSKDEFHALLMNPHAVRVIDAVGVDVVALVDIADFHLFNKKDEIEFVDFLRLVLQLRGSESVCVRDIVILRKFVAEHLSKMEENILHFVASHTTGVL